MKNLIIVGCGAHAAEIVDYIEYINQHSTSDTFKIKGLIDNVKTHYDHYGYHYDFLGTIDDHIIDNEAYYVMGIGNLEIRAKVFQEYELKKARFTGIIHPTALISQSAVIGDGTVISHNVSIGPKVKIGKFNVINSRCTIGHDAIIGDNNFISPQVVLGGASEVGDHNLLGTNSCLIPEIKVGDHNKIMAGMSITNNVHDHETVFYRYKEKLVVRKEFIDKPTIE